MKITKEKNIDKLFSSHKDNRYNKILHIYVDDLHL